MLGPPVTRCPPVANSIYSNKMHFVRTGAIISGTRYVLVVLLTAGIWAGFLTLRGALVESCHDNCQTFAAYARHDPYCAIDPACMSPLYRPGWTRNGTDPQFMPHWQGLAWLDGLGTYDSGLHMLAVPNYVFFMLLLCAVVVIAERKITSPGVRRLVLTVIVTWFVLEAVRWFADISYVDPTVPFFNWELFVTLAVSLLTLWGTGVGTVRWVRNPS